MTCRSEPAPDPQLVAVLDAHGDARAILRDALRWRVIESHLVAGQGLMPNMAIPTKGTLVVMRWPLGVAGFVRGGAGAVIDAIMQERRLDRALSHAAIEGRADG